MQSTIDSLNNITTNAIGVAEDISAVVFNEKFIIILILLILLFIVKIIWGRRR